VLHELWWVHQHPELHFEPLGQVEQQKEPKGHEQQPQDADRLSNHLGDFGLF
jgi:hypothetical protein